jgi:predicted aspartyl protease
MSTFNETITLTNARDAGNADDGLIPESKVRSLTVDACVDTGSWFLVINEKTRAALGLKTTGTDTATLADGSTVEYPVTEPVEFRWKDRKKSMNALLIPDADEVLFGALCMEALDVMPDPVDECLKGRHGDKALYRVK